MILESPSIDCLNSIFNSIWENTKPGALAATSLQFTFVFLTFVFLAGWVSPSTHRSYIQDLRFFVGIKGYSILGASRNVNFCLFRKEDKFEILKFRISEGVSVK